MPLEGFPASRLPTWPEAQVRVLASPALGAQFVQYLIDLPAGSAGAFPPDGRLESFYYVLNGIGTVAGHKAVRPGSYGLLPPAAGLSAKAGRDGPLSLLVLRKAYEPVPRPAGGSANRDRDRDRVLDDRNVPADAEAFEPLHSHESAVDKQAWADNPHSLLQTLVPDEFRYDLAMNIFTFSPGFGLPIVETHVMEHGLYFLQGKGVYYLGDDWMEVEPDDFIWMGPYCPQSFYATGPTPSRYLYYKNVNREVPL